MWLVLFALLFGTAAFLVIYWYYKVSYYSSGLKGMPKTWMAPVLGMAPKFKTTESLLDKNLISILHNDINGFGWGFLLFDCIILISDPVVMEEICSSNKFIDKSQFYSFFHSWLGTGLLTSNNPKWRKHRKMITPSYHFQILEQFVDVFEKNGDVMISKIKQQTNKNCLNVYPIVTLCALDIICESAMGTSVNAQNDDNSEYVNAVKRLCKVLTERSFQPMTRFDFLYRFFNNYKDEKKSIKILHDYTLSVIKRKKEDLASNNKSNILYVDDFGKKKRVAFLDLLLQSKVDGRPLTDTEIREEVDTFMFEGHDTTTAAISFAFHCLANNKDVQEKAMLEQKTIFGDEPNRPVTYQDLQQMKYLELVIKETLRLYPSVPFFGREVVEDSEIHGFHVKKGTQLDLHVFGMHRDPKYFPDPENFIPERFLDQTNWHPFSYMPFSAGPRNCIGQRFAMLEMKSTISKVMRNFELLPAENEPKIVLIAEIILKSGTGIHVKIKDRVWK